MNHLLFRYWDRAYHRGEPLHFTHTERQQFESTNFCLEMIDLLTREVDRRGALAARRKSDIALG